LLVVGVAPGKDGKPLDFAVLGGFISGKLGRSKSVAAVFESPGEPWDAGAAAEFALGVRLRAYRFEKYKTKKNESEANGDEAPLDLVVGVGDRATSSTSRPTFCFRNPSPSAPAPCGPSASRWKSSTKKR
jgi:leucyl aminopeptidase